MTSNQIICACDGNITGIAFSLEIDEHNEIEVTCTACKMVIGRVKLIWMNSVKYREVV